ncbi:MAG: hypothetical protein ACOYJ6_18780 [Caulobacterales bacterium]|jgi:hypothetical protein
MTIDPTWFAIFGLTAIGLALWAWGLIDEAAWRRDKARQDAASRQAE